MKQFFLKLFTWWNSQTFGTQLWTSRFGELVGEDEQGNRYYRTRGGKIDPALGFERRWVIYNGYAEASRIPAGWHGWMHHVVDVPPTEENYQPRGMAKAASAEPDRHAERLPAVGLDARQRQAAEGDRRLPAVDAPLTARALPSFDWMHTHPPHSAVDNGNSGDGACTSVALMRAMRLNEPILRRWETIAFGSGNSSRLSRNAAAADQDSIGR